MDAEPFTARMEVRVYELDPQRHVGGAAYLHYADHCRFACMQSAGISVEELLADGIGPVNLETTIRHRRELRMGDEIPDGEVVAEISHVSGLLDLGTRRLLPNPASELRSRAQRPSVLGQTRG